MGPGREWCPLRWPSGPFWQKPFSLEILQGASINSLVIPWGGRSSELDQLRPLLDAARARGLAIVGWLDSSAPKSAAIASAKAAGLSALATENPPASSEIPLIPVVERSRLPWESSAAILVTTDGVWPSVKASSKGGDSADAGPTGLPWIDSNGWFIRLARSLAPEKAVWLAFEHPKETAVLRANSYLLAVADAAAYGGRWLVSLEAKLRDGIAAGNSQSLADWKRIARSVAFFEQHKEWQRFVPTGVLAVVSDFKGDNEFLGGEALNLLSRRQLPYRILEKSKAASRPLDGFKAVLYPDAQPPASELRKKLVDFVRGGGLLICQPSSKDLAAAAQPSGQTHFRFQVFSLGEGRVAVAKEEISDPYVLAADTHLLMSRRNDLYRIWNAGAIGTYYTVSPDGDRELFQIVNYSGGPATYLAVRLERPYTRARLWTLETDEPREVKMVVGRNSVEFHLPAIFIYAALELEA